MGFSRHACLTLSLRQEEMPQIPEQKGQAVLLDPLDAALLTQFEQRMAAAESVMACYEVSGEFDFLLIVSAESMEQYHAFTREAFSSNHNVRNFKSMFAMNCANFETRIPLRATPMR